MSPDSFPRNHFSIPLIKCAPIEQHERTRNYIYTKLKRNMKHEKCSLKIVSREEESSKLELRPHPRSKSLTCAEYCHRKSSSGRSRRKVTLIDWIHNKLFTAKLPLRWKTFPNLHETFRLQSRTQCKFVNTTEGNNFSAANCPAPFLLFLQLPYSADVDNLSFLDPLPTTSSTLWPNRRTDKDKSWLRD